MTTINVQEVVDEVGQLIKCDGSLHEFLWHSIDWAPSSFEPTVRVPFWWEVFWLLAKNNGDWNVNGWGVMSSGGVFGFGLLQDEALSLMRFSAYAKGYEDGTGVCLQELLIEPWLRWLDIHKAAKERSS